MIRTLLFALALIPTLVTAQATNRIPEVTGDCTIVPSTSSTAAGNVRVRCGSIAELQVNSNGTQSPKIRTGQMNGSTPVRGISLRITRGGVAGRIVSSIAPGMTIERLRGLSGAQLLDAMPNTFPPGSPRDNIDLTSLSIESYEVADHLSQMVLPRCSYVSSEVRQINLMRFRTNTSCMNAGSCLPNNIEICVVRIGCVNDLEYGTVQYNTTCKAENGRCPDVSECIYDDSTTTAVERTSMQRNNSAPGGTAE